jgi:hypothetical protein
VVALGRKILVVPRHGEGFGVGVEAHALLGYACEGGMAGVWVADGRGDFKRRCWRGRKAGCCRNQLCKRVRPCEADAERGAHKIVRTLYTWPPPGGAPSASPSFPAAWCAAFACVWHGPGGTARMPAIGRLNARAAALTTAAAARRTHRCFATPAEISAFAEAFDSPQCLDFP